MGKSSSPSGNTTSTTTSSPWAGQQPYLTQQFTQAQNLYNSGQLAPQYFPGQTVATPSTQTTGAINALTAQATSPQATNLSNANTGLITNTLNGNYLDPTNNPYFSGALNDAADAYARGTAAQTSSAFNSDGAYGGSAYQETQAANNKAFSEGLNNMANTAYQQNQTAQLQASALAPQANSIPYTNIAQEANAGSALDTYNQNLINSQVQQYNYNSQLPYNSLANYISLTGGNYGGQSSTSTPYYSNTGSNALGGAIAGGLAGSSLFGAGGALAGTLGLSGASGGALGAGLGALLPLLSDMRFKDNIHYVGNENGIPTYVFTYTGDPEKVLYKGVMAQEILLMHPEAVEHVNGRYRVNYDRLGVKFERVTVH